MSAAEEALFEAILWTTDILRSEEEDKRQAAQVPHEVRECRVWAWIDVKHDVQGPGLPAPLSDFATGIKVEFGAPLGLLFTTGASDNGGFLAFLTVIRLWSLLAMHMPTFAEFFQRTTKRFISHCRVCARLDAKMQFRSTAGPLCSSVTVAIIPNDRDK